MAGKKDYEALFQEMHPGFFEREQIRSMEEEWACEEMVLPLAEFDPHAYGKTFDASVSFGLLRGRMEELHESQRRVDRLDFLIRQTQKTI